MIQICLVDVHLRPVPSRLNTVNCRDLLWREIDDRVRVRLDLVRGAGPRPGGVPGQRGAGERVGT